MNASRTHGRRRLLTTCGLLLAVATITPGCGGDETTTTAAPTTVSTASVTETTTGGGGPAADGAALYAANCAGCHGAAGEGGSAMAIAGKGFPAPMLEKVIANGVGSMPGFGDKLQPDEIAAIAAYVTGGSQ